MAGLQLNIDDWRVDLVDSAGRRPLSALELWKLVDDGKLEFPYELNGVADISIHFAADVRGVRTSLVADVGGLGEVKFPPDFDFSRDHFLSGRQWIPLRAPQVQQVEEVFREGEHLIANAMGRGSYFKVLKLAGDAGIRCVTNDLDISQIERPLKAATPGLRGVPAPYQRTGIDWLSDYVESGVGAILADEMGLGKTFQALGLIANRRDRGNELILIVCPNTLVANWKKEFEKFLPDHEFLVHTGPHRTRRIHRNLSKGIVLTTYGLLLNDLVEFRKVNWDLVICDEAQALKNRKSKSRIAVGGLKAASKILVTGTPFENSLSDIWSLTDLVVPGILGDAREFERLSETIPNFAQAISATVGPLILRRRVAEVADDLPPIVEIDEPLRMNVSLARDYDERRMQGIATSPAEQFLSLSGALLRICCSQSRDSVDGQPPIDTKFQRMFEILDELASVGEDKVLIFVSWVDAIIQLESILNSRYGQEKIAALHGVTKDRQDLVDSFNEADGFRVLLINPTVGGVGLNITGANHVIHFGRQWNPMLERQATARAWRRGQEKTVFVHKFYYEGTIEDVVQQRLIAKEGLADDVLAGALSEDEDLEQSKARLISPLAVSN